MYRKVPGVRIPLSPLTNNNFIDANTDDGSCIYTDGLCETCEDGVIVDNDLDNDGLCNLEDTIYGCTIPAACNYDSSPTVNTDNIQCVFVSGDCDTCEEGEIVDNDSDDDGVCDSDEIEGCTDATACNYDSTPTTDTDNDLCIYSIDLDAYATCSGEQDGTGVIVDNDSDDDAVCDADEVEGCQDAVACNFMETATDSAACTYSTDLDACATCSGEQDGTGEIVDNDSDDDGVCDSDEIEGCTDATACNYDSTPTTDTDNDLCIYSIDLDACATCSGEQDGTGVIVDNDSDDDAVCDVDEIEGCQDQIACNYHGVSNRFSSLYLFN